MQPYAPPPPGGYGVPNQNPYAPPNPYAQQMQYRQNANFFVPPGAVAGPLPSAWLKTWKLISGIAGVTLTILGFILIFAGIAIDPQAKEPPIVSIIGFITLPVGYLAFFAYSVFSWIWLYQAWNWIPPEERWANMWKKYISPGAAIGFMFIPYFNLYWQFVVYLGIGDALDRMSVKYPSQEPSVKGFAMVPPILRIVFFPAAPIVDYLFAKKVEAKAREMSIAMGQPIV